MRSNRTALLIALTLGIAMSLAAQPPRPRSPLPQTYGTSAVTYLEIPSVEFLPISSSAQFDTSNIWGGRYSPTCHGDCFVAPVHLPAGARVVSLELDYFDQDALDYVVGRFIDCDYAGENCVVHPSAPAGPADCAQPGSICSGKAFSGGAYFTTADLTPDEIVVDNFSHSYRLSAGACCDQNIRIGGMIVGYVLQVSDPPAGADFTDVPPDHPYYKFIEALHAAGITGGCETGPPRYCPDRPITRGEMAVFLSMALGLHFQ